jgi:hypothetical protein
MNQIIRYSNKKPVSLKLSFPFSNNSEGITTNDSNSTNSTNSTLKKNPTTINEMYNELNSTRSNRNSFIDLNKLKEELI